MALPSPNVFITTDLDIITNSFFGNVNYSDFNSLRRDLAAKGLEDYIIASPGKNSNLLEFKYSWGGGKENVDSCLFILKFIDHAYNLEEKFLNKSHYTKVYEQLIPGAAKAYLTTQDLKVRKEVVGAIDDMDSGFNPARIFLAFGLGEKLDNWSGPFVATLINAALEYPNGIKEITLKFAGIGGSMLTNQLISRELGGLENAVDRFSKLQFLNQRIQFTSNVDTTYEKLKKEPYRFVKFCLSNYIAQMGKTRNVITILPYDFSNGLQKALNNNDNTIDEFANMVAQESSTSASVTTTVGFGTKFLSDNDILDKFLQDWGFYVYRKVVPSGKTFNSLGVSKFESSIEQKLPQDGVTLQMKVDKNLTQQINDKGELNNIPDPFFALDRIRNKLNNIVLVENDLYDENNSTISPIRLLEETNIKILKLWKKYGFINKADKSALIYGPQEVLSKLLYPSELVEYNSVQYTDGAGYGQSTMKFTLANELDEIYDNYDYRKEFLETFGKDRTRSSFEEATSIVSDSLDIKESYATAKAKASNIPIFRFNTFNPNVQSISVVNQGAYLDALASTYKQISTRVADNFAVPYLAESNKGIFQDKFINTLSGVLANDLTNVEVLREKIEKYLLDKSNFKIKSNFGIYDTKSNQDIFGRNYGVNPADGQVLEYTHTNFNVANVDFSFWNSPDVWKDVNTFEAGDSSNLLNLEYSKTEQTFKESLYYFLNENSPNAQILRLSRENDIAKYSEDLAKYQAFKDKVKAHKEHGNISKYAMILASTLYEKTQAGTQPEIVAKFNNTPFNAINHFEEELFRMSQPVSIRTLPFFQLASCGDLGKNALLIAYNSKLIGSQFQPKIAFFSGVYTLTGFSHVITSSECYSEFSMIKVSKTDQPNLL